ncbi:MAG: hypothetical protein WC659_01035 [Patescibacteria group bacterium]
MTQLQKNTLLSFILAVGMGIIFSERIGKIYILITKAKSDSLFIVGGAGPTDGLVLVYSFVLGFLLQLFDNGVRSAKITLLGISPIILILLIAGDYKYFFSIIAIAVIGSIIGFGIRKCYEKLVPVKQAPPSS